jgi:hypothetical protein
VRDKLKISEIEKKEMLEDQLKSKVIQRKIKEMRRIDESLYDKGLYTDSHIDEISESAKLDAWIEKFAPYDSDKKQFQGDPRTAIAAYINPHLIFRLIKETGSTDYSVLETLIKDKDKETYYKIANNIYSSQDNWSFMVSRASHDSEVRKWTDLEWDYKRLEELEVKYKHMEKSYRIDRDNELSKITSPQNYVPSKSFVETLDEIEKKEYQSLLDLRQQFYYSENEVDKK